MFREVRVYEIKEVLRLWVRGEGLRSIERMSSVDRKTVRRYVTAAAEAGVDRAGGEDQLDDALLARVCEKVRPRRPDGHGDAWARVVAKHEQLTTWSVDDKVTVVKTNELLCRKGIVVPDRTLYRYALEGCSASADRRGPPRRASPTVSPAGRPYAAFRIAVPNPARPR